MLDRFTDLRYIWEDNSIENIPHHYHTLIEPTVINPLKIMRSATRWIHLPGVKLSTIFQRTDIMLVHKVTFSSSVSTIWGYKDLLSSESWYKVLQIISQHRWEGQHQQDEGRRQLHVWTCLCVLRKTDWELSWWNVNGRLMTFAIVHVFLFRSTIWETLYYIEAQVLRRNSSNKLMITLLSL